MFEEAEFHQAIEELNCPKLEDWEFSVETSPEGVHCKIYRQYDEVCCNECTLVTLFFTTFAVV